MLDRYGHMVHVNGDAGVRSGRSKKLEKTWIVKIALAVVSAELHARETLVEPAIELLEVRLGAKGRHSDKRYQSDRFDAFASAAIPSLKRRHISSDIHS